MVGGRLSLASAWTRATATPPGVHARLPRPCCPDSGPQPCCPRLLRGQGLELGLQQTVCSARLLCPCLHAERLWLPWQGHPHPSVLITAAVTEELWRLRPPSLGATNITVPVLHQEPLCEEACESPPFSSPREDTDSQPARVYTCLLSD